MKKKTKIEYFALSVGYALSAAGFYYQWWHFFAAVCIVGAAANLIMFIVED